MKIIPRITGNERIIKLSEDVTYTLDNRDSIDDDLSKIKERGFNKEAGDKIDGTGLVDESINEVGKSADEVLDDIAKFGERQVLDSSHYPQTRTKDEPAYSWVELFRDMAKDPKIPVRGQPDKEWSKTECIKGDSYRTAENNEFTEDDRINIRDIYNPKNNPIYLSKDFVAYMIFKNALARRSKLRDNASVVALVLDLAGMGFKNVKRVMRTLNKDLIANYLKNNQPSQNDKRKASKDRSSFTGHRENLASSRDLGKGLVLALQDENKSIIAGAEPDPGFTKEIFDFITSNEIAGDSNEKLDINDLVSYAVLIDNVNLAQTAFDIMDNNDNVEINLKKQGRVKGQFDVQIGKKLLKRAMLAKSDAMVRLLKSKGVKLENKNTYNNMKTIIISERQAQMLSLLKLNENSASDVTKNKHGYTTPKNADYVGDSATGTDYEEQLRNKRKSTPGRAKNVHTAFSKSPEQIKGSLSVDGNQKKGAGDPVKATAHQFEKPTAKSLSVDGKPKHATVLNQYFVKEGVEEYTVTTKSDLIKQLLGETKKTKK